MEVQNTEEFSSAIDFLNYSLEEEIKKYDTCHPLGYKILVRIYTPPVQETFKNSKIILPPSIVDRQEEDKKFSTLIGLVVRIAPGVYKDKERYKFTDNYCQVGDWIAFPRASGFTFCHKGMPTIAIEEDMPVLKLDDPRDFSKIKANS